MTNHADTIRTFWDATEARDWGCLAEVLAVDTVYEMQQTRERVRGREAFLDFFRAYPGDWHLTVRRVIADDAGAVSIVDFLVGGEEMTGISFFDFDGSGLVSRIEDVWPEPYEPPADRAHLVERY